MKKHIITLNEKQKQIISKCIEANKNEIDKWYLKNLLFPLGVFLLPVLGLFFTKNKSLIDIITNGGLSLIGINLILAMSSYLIKYDQTKNQNWDKERLYLREKLAYIGNFLIIVGTFLYALQRLIIFTFDFYLLSILILTIIVLFFSVSVGFKLFIIKDDLFANAFNEEMAEKRQNLNNAIEDL